jgi:endonuclease/exonuclease/phosphatase family metal-dependent hydrolase
MRSLRRSAMGRTAMMASMLAACSSPGTDTDQQDLLEESAAPGRHTGQIARVMTRNLYLGADLTPVIGATDLASLVASGGAVLRQVTATNFPVRAKGLAAEILDARPDLVGLQEVALWRTGPASVAPLLGGPKTATTVRYDFLELLLGELNAGEARYRPVVIQEELDFEAPADENGIAGDGAGYTPDAELNARLTMRDVILARVDAGVHVSGPMAGHFQHLLEVPILGSSLAVTRGWTRVDARVRGGRPFRFVNTHLESFDPPTLIPSIRALQAGELVASGGPATGDLPVVLVGDLNSGGPPVPPGDQQAYRALLDAGFVAADAGDPPTCCIESYDLTGTEVMFTQHLDHVLTNAPDAVQLVESVVTGGAMANGYWDSDHTGVVSALLIR